MIQYKPNCGFTIGLEPNRATKELLGLDDNQPVPPGVELEDGQIDCVVYVVFTGQSAPSIFAPSAKPQMAILARGPEVFRVPKKELDARAEQAFGGGGGAG